MARAKRTDRAEARRRHRASIGDPIIDGDLDETVEPARAAPSTRASGGGRASAPAASGTAGRPPRPGIINAFRTSFRPIDLRGDLRALPRLLTHWSFYVPVVLCGAAIVVAQYNPQDTLMNALAGNLTGLGTGAPPFLAVLLAGFFAPRASYLVGALVALAGAAFLALTYTVQYSGLPSSDTLAVVVNLGGQVVPVTTSTLNAGYPGVITQAFVVGPVYGALFAAAAAFYRRFLNAASPARAARQGATPTGGRRPDGKIARKNEQRPLLARRR